MSCLCACACACVFVSQPPWFDDRVAPAVRAMNVVGQSEVSLAELYEVLSVKPVFNLQTTYTILAQPSIGSYETFVRYCPYPCAE